MTVRRVKSYSADSGYVYQYYFEEVRPRQDRQGQAGSEYAFVVTRDRKHNYVVPVFVRRDAVEAWGRAHRREMTGTEEYASAKMRLFRAFDEADDLERDRLQVEVTPENIEELLAPLDLA